jgi:hypothetical protein
MCLATLIVVLSIEVECVLHQKNLSIAGAGEHLQTEFDTGPKARIEVEYFIFDSDL